MSARRGGNLTDETGNAVGCGKGQHMSGTIDEFNVQLWQECLEGFPVVRGIENTVVRAVHNGHGHGERAVLREQLRHIFRNGHRVC